MSKQLGCSASLIYKKLSSNNLQMSKKFSHMDDVALDESVRQVQRKNTRAGCEVDIIKNKRLSGGGADGYRGGSKVRG